MLVKLLMDYFVHLSCQWIYIVTCITDLLLLFICVYLLISLGLCFCVVFCCCFFNADIFDLLFLKYNSFFCYIIVGQV